MFEHPFRAFAVNSSFLTLLFLSLIFHIGLISLYKLPSLPEDPDEKVIEVELLKIEEPKIKPDLEPKQAEQTKASQSGPPSAEKESSKAADKRTEVETAPEPAPVPKPSLSVKSSLEGFADKAKAISIRENGQQTLQIPKWEQKNEKADESAALPQKPESLSWQNAVSRQATPKTGAQPGGVSVNELVNKNIVEEAQSGHSLKTGSQTTTEGEGGKIEETTQTRSFQGATIEGEVSNREVIHRPEPPQLNLDRNVTVILKFTVLPNGQVDKVEPYQKAEPELENLAIQMLQQFRFKPLFGNTSVQSGIIHFTLHRKQQ